RRPRRSDDRSGAGPGTVSVQGRKRRIERGEGMSSDPIVVLKFGSSVLAEAGDIPLAVHEIYRSLREGKRVVAVVSALGPTTHRLLSPAHSLAGSPEPAGLAALLSTGEATTAALLAIALDRAGLPATLLDPCRVGLRTEGAVLDSEPREINRRE